jgi:glutathione S-transferase
LDLCECDWQLIDTDYAASANLSPTQRVPYFTDGELVLTDSTPILKYIREKSGQSFLPDIQDYELYAMTNTLMDTTVNLFLLELVDDVKPNPEKSLATKVGPGTGNYLLRQQDRIHTGLKELNNKGLVFDKNYNDAHIRLACYLDWAIFRNRISLDEFANLQQFLTSANQWDLFASTSPANT